MKRIEKYLVLNALISEIIYAANENKKRKMSYSLESGHGKTYTDLYHKLAEKYFKNDAVSYNANLRYFNEKMKEVE